MNHLVEISYPVTFREKESRELGTHLKNRHSVVMVGIKRVGISSFLRFFLYHKEIAKKYIGDGKRHLFVAIDLHDLVERELFPFWILTFKRITDAVGELKDERLKKQADALFLNSIQSNNLFLTIDNIRQVLTLLVDNDIMPTCFFIRFDRIVEAANPEFFANIIGLVDATHQKLSCVFTSYRNLHELSPQMFPRSSVSAFAQDMYLRPAQHQDVEVIYKTYKSKYKLSLGHEVEKELFYLADGYIQYLQLALIVILEDKQKNLTREELITLLLTDERIVLQSEELWESLSEIEKKTLIHVVFERPIEEKEKKQSKYLWDSGFIRNERGKQKLFSPLFAHFVKEKGEDLAESSGELSKKENMLFLLLKSHKDAICERETIVEQVWSEVESFGVSDWAIDRLVARLRNKLKLQKSPFEIQTIKTRGYKLVKA